MKYLAKSQNNKMVQLGEDIKRGKWFYITEAVANDVDSLKVGDDITFVSEPRGGAFYITFLAKGTVEPPVTSVPKPVVMSTPVAAPAGTVKPFQKWTPSGNKAEMSKEDWEKKERRDFKGRSIMYASTAIAATDVKFTGTGEYLEHLFNVAKEIEEYIYQ